MKAALEGLIRRLIEFDKALTADVDRALMTFSNGRTMLAPPAPKD